MLDLLIVRLALALLIGLLVGLERGWRDRDMTEIAKRSYFDVRRP